VESGLKIGQVAKRAGVRVDTVRFYEREGLLPKAARTPSGYRMFSPTTVERVVFIKEAQCLGVTLVELADFLRSLDRGEANPKDTRARLEGVLARIDARLAELRRIRRNLVTALDGLDSGKKGLLVERACRLAGRG
jgi:DNA-binding transcriptional MerR regulator